MQTNFANEKKIDLIQAQKIAPGKPSIASLWRWCTKGIHGVRLEYWRRGRQMFTSAEALTRFFTALTERDRYTQETPTPRPSAASSQSRPASKRQASVNRARAQLSAAGI